MDAVKEGQKLAWKEPKGDASHFDLERDAKSSIQGGIGKLSEMGEQLLDILKAEAGEKSDSHKEIK